VNGFGGRPFERASQSQPNLGRFRSAPSTDDLNGVLPRLGMAARWVEGFGGDLIGLSSLPVVRGVKVVLKVVEGCKSKNHNGGWKCQPPHDSQGVSPICRAKEEETGEH
jgi:hypothetical protein